MEKQSQYRTSRTGKSEYAAQCKGVKKIMESSPNGISHAADAKATENIELGKAVMKLRTILSVATIFMVFITVAAWKTPLRGEN